MSAERKLRILYLANAGSIHTKRWVGWFARRHDVMLVSVPELGDAVWDRPEIPLARDAPAYRWPLVSSVLLVRYLRASIAGFRPDFVHAHYLAPNAWLATATGHPRVVTTSWGSDLLLAGGLATLLNAWALRRACLNTADSQEAVDRLRAIVGVGSSERVHLVQFGVDANVFAPAAPSGELRRAWQIPASARLLVSPRILRPLYNAETIARAFIALAPRVPDLYLVFLAYNADSAYRHTVEDALAGAGLSDRVRFPAGVPHALMPELYRDAAAILSVPSSDTTPVTLLEGMACGSVVIASDLPSIREWVTHGEQGFLVVPGCAEALASAIGKVLELSPEARSRMAAAGRRLVVERASQDVEMRKMERLMLDVLAAKAANV